MNPSGITVDVNSLPVRCRFGFGAPDRSFRRARVFWCFLAINGTFSNEAGQVIYRLINDRRGILSFRFSHLCCWGNSINAFRSGSPDDAHWVIKDSGDVESLLAGWLVPGPEC